MKTDVSIMPIQSSYKIGDRTIGATVLHDEPLVMQFNEVLSDDECQALIVSASTRMSRSKLASKDISNIRTSSGMFFNEQESPLIAEIERRIASLMHIPLSHAEGLQVLRYEQEQQFKEHYDFFAENNAASRNNRISTLIVYLNDVEEGGETNFPNLGLSIKPIKGSAIYFEYFYYDQAINEKTLHSGQPVIRGEKWVVTQWMRKQSIRE